MTWWPCEPRPWLRVLAILMWVSLFCAQANATPPILLSQPEYESPVRADPDDLLLLAGTGFSASDVVVYQSISNTTANLSSPAEVPRESSASLGIAPIASTADLPFSLTIRLPSSLRSGQSYALWVRNPIGEWSRPLRINDARPLWLSPVVVYASAAIAGLPRYIKVVGQNLQPVSGRRTLVRLMGPESLTLSATIHRDRLADLDRYVARCALPSRLTPGRYRVSVSRDGRSWVPLPAQWLEVRADPDPPRQFDVGAARFGGCRAGDGKDDTGCIVQAIAAARASGGGTVVFGAGTWNLIDGSQAGLLASEGIVLESGVNLRGSGQGRTVLVRQASWNVPRALPAFSLIGHNAVQNLTFKDEQHYKPGDLAGPFLQLGETFQRVLAQDPLHRARVSDIVISGDIFDVPFIAIADGGLPIERLFITGNTFASYVSSIDLPGHRFNFDYRFGIDDAVISGNVFKPSSYIDVAHRTGVLATELGAGRRVDFSDNVADGAASDYLYGPQDAPGWRAAFFWDMNGNHEMELVANNSASCTGDKIADGEAISYDNNANTFAFDRAETVSSSTADSITVEGPLQRSQFGHAVSSSYYVGHWIQVGAGPGLGEVRKITTYEVDASSGRVTFHVAPHWDVPPAAGSSRISVGREFWQLYTVANTVDQRRPPCQKANASDRKGGVIDIWAQASDSVIEGNRQFDTDGILWQQYYSVRDQACPDCESGTHYVGFLQIRDNLIDGEYDWDDDCSSSGITGSLAASPSPESPPPTVSYGLAISHNTIRHADARAGGAISFSAGWYKGPAPYRWALVDNPLIFHNSIDNLWASPARPCQKDPPHDRTGISLSGSTLVSHTVLYHNSCSAVPQPLDAGDARIVRICPPAALTGFCECSR